MNTFLEAMKFRHACKQFDAEKVIPKESFQNILEFGRLSPSSFGMEQWKFVMVESDEKRTALKGACWGQPQITECSHALIILAKVADVQPGTDYVEAMFRRRGLPDKAFKLYLDKYAEYHQTEVEPYMSCFAWSSKQCYIALANMMTGAAAMGIDSCPIEGFSRKAVDQMLDLDTKQYQTAVIVTFGYRAGEQTACFRQDMNDLVQTI